MDTLFTHLRRTPLKIMWALTLLSMLTPSLLFAQGSPSVDAGKNTPLLGKMDFKPFVENFFLFGNLTGYGAYSKLLQGSPLNGGNVSGYIAPAFRFTDSFFFLLLANGSYAKTKQVYREDRGTRISSESASYSLTPTVKVNITPKVALSASYLFTRALSKQTSDTRWGKDLYDYKEKGIGFDITYLLDKKEDYTKSLKTTLQFYNRKYPNFISLFTLTGLGNIEEREKDYKGTLFSLTYDEQHKAGFSFLLGFNALFKDYSDKRLETVDGTRDRRYQQDQEYTFNGSLAYRERPDGFHYGLDFNLIYTVSNQNLASGSFPAITFTRNYYSNVSYNVKPGIEYITFFEGGKLLKLGGSYGFTMLRYAGREAFDPFGVSKKIKEVDLVHDISLTANYSLDEHLSFGAIASLYAARSNNKDERTFRYNYEIFTFSLGLSYSF